MFSTIGIFARRRVEAFTQAKRLEKSSFFDILGEPLLGDNNVFLGTQNIFANEKLVFSENFQKICNPKKSPFLEFQRIFRNFSENRPGISENRQFSITSHERDDMC